MLVNRHKIKMLPPSLLPFLSQSNKYLQCIHGMVFDFRSILTILLSYCHDISTKIQYVELFLPSAFPIFSHFSAAKLIASY